MHPKSNSCLPAPSAVARGPDSKGAGLMGPTPGPAAAKRQIIVTLPDRGVGRWSR
jgi:hypothetical protein